MISFQYPGLLDQDNAPHCPKRLGSYKFNDRFKLTPPDSFSIRTLCLGPASPIFSGWRQLSVPAPTATVGVAGVKGANVAKGVKVGARVGLGVLVGGMGVFVGIANWVAATIVHAAAIAVDCMSAGLNVASGSGPQAASSIAHARIIGRVFRVISFLS